MNHLDIYFAIPIVLGLVLGLFKGLIREVIGLAIIFVGIYLAKTFNPAGAQYLMDHFTVQEGTAKPLAFVLIFLVVAVVLSLTGKILEKILQGISIGGLNKLLGGVFGALKYAVIISIVLNLMESFDSAFSIIDPEEKEESFLYEPLKELGPDLWEKVTREKEIPMMPKKDSVQSPGTVNI